MSQNNFINQSAFNIKSKEEYKGDFPTLGGKAKKQNKQDIMASKTLEDIATYNATSGKNKQPVKFSDSAKTFAKRDNLERLQKRGMDVTPYVGNGNISKYAGCSASEVAAREEIIMKLKVSDSIS